MKLSVSKHLFVVAGILAAPAPLRVQPAVKAQPAEHRPDFVGHIDPRTLRLHEFLSALNCPIKDMAEDFVQAADDNDLDWRLLPSISLIESSGGKAFKNNNILGWDNCDRRFPTVRAGIHQVAYHLGRSPIYRDRNTLQKLHIYNPNQGYAARVEAVMRRISPTPTPFTPLPQLSSVRPFETALFARN